MPDFTARRLLRFAERISLVTGHACSWLALAMVLLMALVVLLRYGLGVGSIALQESVLYLHGALFMVGAAYTLARDEHVRVDIFYRDFSVTGRAWVNLLGSIVFLIPLAVLFFWSSLDYVVASWVRQEGSPEAGGLPWLYMLKSLLLVMPVLLVIQGLAEILRALVTLRHPDAPPARDADEQEGQGWN